MTYQPHQSEDVSLKAALAVPQAEKKLPAELGVRVLEALECALIWVERTEASMRLQRTTSDFAAWLSAAPPIPPVEPVQPDPWRHASNEWADMATNGLQWVKNIRDGVSTPAEAIASLEANLEHCKGVQPDAAPKASGQPAVRTLVRINHVAPPGFGPMTDAMAPVEWKATHGCTHECRNGVRCQCDDEVKPAVQAMSDEQREHIHQAIDMLEDYEGIMRRAGQDSTAAGAAATCYVLRSILSAAIQPARKGE